MRHWLLKSEPSTYAIDDLEREPDRTTYWDGVRNYQARNYIRDEMRRGDRALFYHSSCAEPAVVGVVTIASDPYPDPTQFDRGSRYFDPKATPEAPRWYVVDVRLDRRLPRPVTLAELKAEADAFEGFPLLRRGNRLSVMPVAPEHFRRILQMARRRPRAA